jgi:hypothetical protein
LAKRLSEQLAELSVRAKNAEDAVTAAEKETHDKVVVRIEQAHTAATAAKSALTEPRVGHPIVHRPFLRQVGL